jgi:hypothetical protein
MTDGARILSKPYKVRRVKLERERGIRLGKEKGGFETRPYEAHLRFLMHVFVRCACQNGLYTGAVRAASAATSARDKARLYRRTSSIRPRKGSEG